MSVSGAFVKLCVGCGLVVIGVGNYTLVMPLGYIPKHK